MTTGERIGLVGCVKSKRAVPTAARGLYTSPLFEGRRRWVERTCDRWFVLSALHGLVDPGEELAPYDVTLKDASENERRAWSERVLQDLRGTVGDLHGVEFEIHAGREYVDFGLESGLLAAGADVVRPAEGLGLGQQLALYSGEQARPATHAGSLRRESVGAPSSGEVGGKYAALKEWLASRAGSVETTFDQIEALVGPLPASARRYRPWWANDASHSQARAWLALGRKVERVEMERGRVRFGPPE